MTQFQDDEPLRAEAIPGPTRWTRFAEETAEQFRDRVRSDAARLRLRFGFLCEPTDRRQPR